MAVRRDEIEAAMDAVVDDVPAIQAALIAQEAFELIVDVLNDGLETKDMRLSSVRFHNACC